MLKKMVDRNMKKIKIIKIIIFSRLKKKILNFNIN